MTQRLHLRIASPCTAPWENMDGDARVRFCRECNRNVYNLSAMSETEAHTLVAEREGRMCVRFYQRRDGTVLTTDCPVGRKRSLLSRTARGAFALVAMTFGASKLTACGDEGGQPEIMGDVMLGSVAVEEETPQVLMGKIAPPDRDD